MEPEPTLERLPPLRRTDGVRRCRSHDPGPPRRPMPSLVCGRIRSITDPSTAPGPPCGRGRCDLTEEAGLVPQDRSEIDLPSSASMTARSGGPPRRPASAGHRHGVESASVSPTPRPHRPAPGPGVVETLLAEWGRRSQGGAQLALHHGHAFLCLDTGWQRSCRTGPRIGLIGASRPEPAPAALGAAGGGERDAVTEAAAVE